MFGNSGKNLYISFGLNKFLAPLPRILVSLGNGFINLNMHNFGPNKFLAPLPGILVSLGNSGRNLVIHNFGQQVFGVVVGNSS